MAVQEIFWLLFFLFLCIYQFKIFIFICRINILYHTKVLTKIQQRQKRLIKGHDNIILNGKEEINEKKCNCRDARNCPLNGNSLVGNFIYKAMVKPDKHSEKIYFDSKENSKGDFTNIKHT